MILLYYIILYHIYVCVYCVHYELTMQKNSRFIWKKWDFGWVSNWRVSGLNGGEVEDKNQAHEASRPTMVNLDNFHQEPRPKDWRLSTSGELKTEGWDVINVELDLRRQKQNIFLYLEISWSPLSNATRTTQFGDSYKEQSANHWRLRRLNRIWTECSAGVKRA